MMDSAYKMQLDSVQIGAADLPAASRDYALLLGVVPQLRRDGLIRFQLKTGAVELIEGAEGVCSIRFTVDSTWTGGERGRFNGIDVLFSSPSEEPAAATGVGSVEAIDHVVVQTTKIDRALALWRDKLGLRLALDREFPGRGLRLVFFRSGGITLEIAGPLQAVAG
ncbi:MAG TPA: VOC family protein, partial [Candidatus Acidoferrales bacterium]|nr:VOC family protein [Candidatus Acidoferrales bacterium]